jgi:penicillin-binding protein 1C
MWDVSGVTGAAPVWAAIVGYLHRRVPSVAPAAPPGVERVRVQFADAVEPSRNEWFIAGTSTPLVGLASNAADLARGPAQIGSPVDGTIFALDPDIPAQRQRVWFERASGSTAQVSWRLDGRALGGGARVAWLPWPGKHRLELVDARGQVTDTVRFEVRGAMAKPQKSAQADAGQRGPAR